MPFVCYVFVHKFLFNTHFYVEPDYIIRKPIVHRIQRYILHRVILSTFHTRVDHRSVHPFPIEKNRVQNSEKCQKPCQKQPFPLEARGLPSNTWMPGPTPLTTPNDSSIAVRTSTQQCNKVPIGYNGTPQIHITNCPFPFNDHHTKPNPTHHPKRHPDPISRFATIHMRRPTDGPSECSVTLALHSIESDALKTVYLELS